MSTQTPAEVAQAMKRWQLRHQRRLDVRLAPLGISLVQWDALRHLRGNPSASLHDLARLTCQTDQSLGALASRMIDRGLIVRVPGPGRVVRHRITEKGEQLRRRAQPVVDDALADSFAALDTDELDTLGGYLARLLAGD